MGILNLHKKGGRKGIITGENLSLRFYDHKDGSFANIKARKLVYNLQPGQEIYNITYSGSAVNKFLKYNIKILDVTEEGVSFRDWDEEFYPWEMDHTNWCGETGKVHIVIEPCEALYQKPESIKTLINGEIQHEKKIWYRHGGWRGWSKYEKNLENFILLEQLSMF